MTTLQLESPTTIIHKLANFKNKCITLFIGGKLFSKLENEEVELDNAASSSSFEEDESSGANTKYPAAGCRLVLTRKNVMNFFLNGELENEIRERKLCKEVNLSSSNTREMIMKDIDQKRRSEVYPHPPEDCSQECVRRG